MKPSTFMLAMCTVMPCGAGPEPADYTSARGMDYYWKGGTLKPADIEAVEDALHARGLCDRPAPSAAYVRVFAEPFPCFGSRTGKCAGQYPGWIDVAGEPWRCAGQSALLHELFHACGDGTAFTHEDERWALADQPVECAR